MILLHNIDPQMIKPFNESFLQTIIRKFISLKDRLFIRTEVNVPYYLSTIDFPIDKK